MSVEDETLARETASHARDDIVDLVGRAMAFHHDAPAAVDRIFSISVTIADVSPGGFSQSTPQAIA